MFQFFQRHVYFYALMLVLQVLISPAFACQCGLKASSVKANMHTLQTMAETYAVDWNGQFPSSLIVLVIEAKQKNYWKEFSNPMNAQSGLGNALIDLKRLHGFKNLALCQIELLGIPVRFDDIPCSSRSSKSEYRGMVIYEARSDSSHTQAARNLGYFIYGIDHAGNLIEDKQKPFYLSNS